MAAREGNTNRLSLNEAEMSSIVEAGGGKYVGVLKEILGRMESIVLFVSPQTRSTLGIPMSRLTVEACASNSPNPMAPSQRQVLMTDEIGVRVILGHTPPFSLFSFPMKLLMREADSAHEILEARIRAEGIEARARQDTRIKPLLESFFQPIHCLIPISESRIDHSNLRSV